jgi:hypothetical protein
LKVVVDVVVSQCRHYLEFLVGRSQASSGQLRVCTLPGCSALGNNLQQNKVHYYQYLFNEYIYSLLAICRGFFVRYCCSLTNDLQNPILYSSSSVVGAALAMLLLQDFIATLLSLCTVGTDGHCCGVKMVSALSYDDNMISRSSYDLWGVSSYDLWGSLVVRSMGESRAGPFANSSSRQNPFSLSDSRLQSSWYTK